MHSAETIRNAFARFDTNGDGMLSPEELHAALAPSCGERTARIVRALIEDFVRCTPCSTAARSPAARTRPALTAARPRRRTPTTTACSRWTS